MRSVAAHFVLAVIGLSLAYFAWTVPAPAERAPSEVTIFECAENAIRDVTFTSEKQDVRLQMKTEGDARYAWIEATKKIEGKTEAPKGFVGGKEVTEYLGKLAPLRALRSLGDLDEKMLTDLELKTPKGKLSVSCGEKKREFELGGSAVGTADRYARSTQGGPVYLVAADIVGQLENAEFRLMQRDVHRFTLRDIDTVTIQSEGTEQTLKHKNRLEPEKAAWVLSSDEERLNVLYDNWLDRVMRLRVQEYLAPDKEPGSDLDGPGARKEIVSLRYFDGSRKTVGELSLVRVETKEADKPAYYAKSNDTRTWVKVVSSIGKQVEDDVRSVLGLEAAESESAPADPNAAP